MDTRTTFKIVFVVGFLIAATIRAISVKRAGRERRTPADAVEIVMLFLTFIGMQVLPLIYLFTTWLDFANYSLPAWPGWIGAALFAAGQWFIWRSHADLGRQWTATPEIRETHQLITDGVYRHIRHPMYVGHLLWGIAQPLLLHNWLAGFGYLAAQILLYAIRIPREEQMMLAHFGDAYRAYMQRTGSLFPRWNR